MNIQVIDLQMRTISYNNEYFIDYSSMGMGFDAQNCGISLISIEK